MNDEILRDQVNELIRDEIQQNINEYVDSKIKKSQRSTLFEIKKLDS
jgi:hypothetical protein